MKYLKMSMHLLLTAVIFTSCEKETTPLSEEPAMNLQGPKSIVEIVNSGIDLETYFNSMPKPENSGARPAYSQLTNPDLQFFYSPEEFPCSNLPMEDFEEGNTTGISAIPNNLDQNTDNQIFSPGDILPGVQFSTGTGFNDFGIAVLAANIGLRNNSKCIYANYGDGLIINFTTNDVFDVSLDILTEYSDYTVNIQIFGIDGLIGATTVNANGAGTFWGVKSSDNIVKIVIDGPSFEGIDNLVFGVCDFDGDGVLNENDLCANTPSGEEVNSNGCAQSQLDDDNDGVMNTVDSCSNTPSGEAVNENGCGQSQLDYDGDGVMNNKDLHIYSILGGVINIGGCFPNVNNKMVKNGSTMMDQIKDLTAQINSQYNGQNYATLHSKFMAELAQITYNWRTARLITTTQRSQISSCAWGSNIPYYNNDN